MPKYTDKQNNIEYSNLSKPSITLTNGQTIGGKYKYNNNDTELIPGSPILNAIDINWGSAILQYLSGTTSIYTTSDLLKYLQNLNTNIVQNKITGIKIKDKEYTFDNGTVEINDIISDIIISGSDIVGNNHNLNPDSNGIIDISPLIDPIKTEIDNVKETIGSQSEEIQTIKAQLGSVNISEEYIASVLNNNFPTVDWNKTEGEPGYIANKPNIPDGELIKHTVIDSLPQVIATTIENDTDVRSEIVSIVQENIGTIEVQNGLSAYEIYEQECQNSGKTPLSQADWIESLKGATGPQGEPGNAISIKQENEIENPGDAYIYHTSNGSTFLRVYQGLDVNGNRIFEDCDLNVVITPGSPPIVDEDGYWRWWSYEEQRYIDTVEGENGEPIRIKASGEQGPQGLDIYQLASTNYYSSEHDENVEFPSFLEWYAQKVIPHINEQGFWVIDTDPNSPTTITTKVLTYKVGNDTISAKAIGEKGEPGRSPRIVGTSINGSDTLTYIWEVWNNDTNSYVPAQNDKGEFIQAEGVSGKDGKDLKLNLISNDKLLTTYVKEENGAYTFNVSAIPADGYIAVNYVSTPDPQKFAEFIEYNEPGIYYIYNNGSNYEWVYAGKIQGERGENGNSAYEIALNNAIEKYNLENPDSKITDWESTKESGNVPETLAYLVTEESWVNSLRATTISNEVKNQIIDDIKNDLDYVASVIINGKTGTLTDNTANIDITGENIQISSTNASTLAEFADDITEKVTSSIPGDGTLTIEINSNTASNIIFSANTTNLATVNLPNIIGENISNNHTISSIQQNIDTLNASVNKVEQAIGFTPEDFDTITTLKNVIEELQNPETGTMDSVLDDIVNGIGNKVEKIDLVIPSSDYQTTATLSININNPTADLSDKIVTGISINNNTLSPATGLVTIGSVVTNIKYTAKDENNEDQIITIENSNGNISLDDFATTIYNNIKDEIESISDNKYVATTDNYVKAIKVDTGVTPNVEDIEAQTGTVVLKLSDYAKKMKLIIEKYTKKVEDNGEVTYVTEDKTLNIGNGDEILDMSAYATKKDIDEISGSVNEINESLTNNYYNKTQIDNSMKWNVITE